MFDIICVAADSICSREYSIAPPDGTSATSCVPLALPVCTSATSCVPPVFPVEPEGLVNKKLILPGEAETTP